MNGSFLESLNSISAKVKDRMTSINDLYCGKHLVLNKQEYEAAALNDWEVVESGGKKIGREKHRVCHMHLGHSNSL